MADIATSVYKSMASSLGKFATTREKAKGPESNIGVQVKGGMLKLISGNSRAGMVVTAGGIDADDTNFIVDARPFLQGAKVLPAKSSVSFVVSKTNLSAITDTGGRIEMSARGTLRDAGFPKLPKNHSAKGSVVGTDWERIARLFKSVSAKVEVPAVQVLNATGHMTAVAPGNRAAYVDMKFPAEGLDGYNMAAYLDFWVGLSGLEADGTISWGKDGVVATDGNSVCFSAPYLVSKYNPKVGPEPPKEAPPWPLLALKGSFATEAVIDRKNLINVIKGQAPFDVHNRVTIEVETGSVRVSPFGGNTGQSFDAQATGTGIRSVGAEYFISLLSNIESKEVTLRWGGGQPAISIAAGGYESWTILLAPVTI